MCGIAGWYARGRIGVERRVIARQCDAILHRGPDDDGILIDGNFGFGMRRLSIIDIAGGHQPMETDEGRFSIVFNGEIYNHLQLREELLARGHRFRSHSDTETILAAYEEWRDGTWRRLDGMFAVAIWDRRERRLTLARDHLGIKPLYYSLQNGGIGFGSELKVLMALPRHQFDIDPRAAHDVFTFGHVRTPRSIYTQVRTLPPGHQLTMGPVGEAQVRPFWRPAYVHAPARSESEWIAEFRERWRETVRSHLLADVEVGAFLSGGIDSSAVVAMMSQVTDAPIKTFTIGFPVERYNEAPYAEAVARHLGCIHTTRMIDLRRARDLLPQLQSGYDEPFADPSTIPTWYLSGLAREQVKVVLSGDGGDELFMGYKRHLTAHRLAAVPLSMRKATAAAVGSLPSTPVRTWNRKIQRWQKSTAAARLPDGVSRFFALTQITSPSLRRRVLSRELIDAIEGSDFFEDLRDEYFPDPEDSISPNELEQLAYADLTLNLPCAMLTKVDRASMAHSLEVRVPLLSRSMVEWGMGVPPEMKIKGKTGKYLLREAIKPWMPEGIADRRKQGFQIPIAEWFDGDFGDYARELWRESRVSDLGLLRSEEVDAVFAEHRSGKRDHGRFLYALAQFSLWWANLKTTSLKPAPALAVAAPSILTRPTAAANDDIAPAPKRAAGARRLAALIALFAAGWLVHGWTGSTSSSAQASAFVDDAVHAHRADLVSDTVGSMPKFARYDREDVARRTGVHMPRLPADWKILDVQVVPWGEAQSVNMAIELPDKERLSIFGMNIPTSGGGRPVVANRKQNHIVYWQEGDTTMALVGPLESRRLLQLAALLDPDGPAVST